MNEEERWPSWEEAELLQRRSEAALPFIEKLRWLEEAQELVEHMQRSRAERVKDAQREQP